MAGHQLTNRHQARLLCYGLRQQRRRSSNIDNTRHIQRLGFHSSYRVYIRRGFSIRFPNSSGMHWTASLASLNYHLLPLKYNFP